MSPADLELLISHASADTYTLTLRFRYPAARQDKRFDGAWTLDEVELRKHELDPAAYGEQLAAQLLAEPDARSFLDQALAAAGSQQTPLHLRLFIADKAKALHSLRWETLRLPGAAAPLATGDWVYFSRYLDSRSWLPVHVPQRAALRALIAIAGPDVSGTNWAEVRTDDELQAAQAGLGDIPAVALATRGQVTLANLMANVREGCDILYLVAHGIMRDGEPWVLLEQPNGGRAWTSGKKLAVRLGKLAQPPILVVLVSCQSAGSGKGEDERALAALGPQLAAAGVPAVVAMQGNVSMDTAAAFMPLFLAELRRDGQVDRAMAVARDEVCERPDWYMPVLFTRLVDGRLFELPTAKLPGDPPSLDAALALLAGLPLEEMPLVSPLPAGSRMPFSPNPLFVGRADDLRALAKILQAGATAAVGQVAATTGLGGIGKTQLAVEFAHRYGRFFAGGVLWLSCSDPNAVATEVVACGLAMGLPAFEALDFPDQVRRVQQAWQQPIPRLLIFDNCEEEAVLDDWRPATGGCRVLVTSRRASWSAGLGVRSLALPVLPRAEGVALLRRFREDLAEGDPVLDAIAAELGDLPLALHLAGSFLARYRFDVTPAAYLDQLRRPDLLAHRSLVTGDWSPTEHETHVGRTFALSYDRLDPEDAVDGLALALLARLACFTPGEPVARELLLLTLNAEPPKRNPTMKERLQRLARPRSAAREQEADKVLTPEAIERLVMLGLIDEQADGSLVIHRLVAAFVGGVAGAKEAQGAVEEALGQEADRINETGLPALLLPWQGHLRHVTDRARARGDVQAAWLCNELGYHLKETGVLPVARTYYEQALAIFREALGEAHPVTATSLNNLGILLQAMGDLPAAKPYYEQALAIWRQALGETHPLTATSLNNLGLLLHDMGDLPAAKPYLEHALVLRRQALGEAHPDTAASLNNLGLLLRAMGDLPAAKPYYEQALAIRRQALGEAHPATAQSLNNLGMLLQAMGDLPAAKPYLEQALVITRQALGDTHPDTAASLNNLGLLLHDMGDLPAAKPYYEHALVLRRQALGDTHPDTAASLNNLGLLLQDMGDLPAAKLCHEQVLAIWRQALGEDHPFTATSRDNLGLLLRAMGDLQAAKPYFEHALVLRRQALGDTHADTAASLNNLGLLLQDMGDLLAARTYLQQAQAIWRQALGEDHPLTATSLNNLGLLLRDMGDLPAAKAYLEHALVVTRKALGEAHPDTATSLNNLGTLLQSMGDLPAAQPYLEQAVAILERSLGPNHPNTQAGRRNLERLLDEMATAATPSATPA
jgi:tetratricopeptide (TPR) repeat protein